MKLPMPPECSWLGEFGCSIETDMCDDQDDNGVFTDPNDGTRRVVPVAFHPTAIVQKSVV